MQQSDSSDFGGVLQSEIAKSPLGLALSGELSVEPLVNGKTTVDGNHTQNPNNYVLIHASNIDINTSPSWYGASWPDGSWVLTCQEMHSDASRVEYIPLLQPKYTPESWY